MSSVLQICPLTAAGLELPAVALIPPAPNFSFCRLPNYNMYFSSSTQGVKDYGVMVKLHHYIITDFSKESIFLGSQSKQHN